MDSHPNLYDLIDEMGTLLITLQTDMIKVMSGINQLNLLISKIKQQKTSNFNSINNMMSNINNNMQNMAMGMNNMIGMQGLNMPMAINPMQEMMNNMNFGMQNINIEDEKGWNLIFENNSDKTTVSIRINEQKLFKEAITMYKLKSGRTDKCKFIFNRYEIFPELKICQTGLENLSKITVVSLQDVRGG